MITFLIGMLCGYILSQRLEQLCEWFLKIIRGKKNEEV